MGLPLAYEVIKRNEAKDAVSKGGANGTPTRQSPTTSYTKRDHRISVRREDFGNGKSQILVKQFPQDNAAAQEANRLDAELTRKGYVRQVGSDATGNPRPGGHRRKPSAKDGK